MFLVAIALMICSPAVLADENALAEELLQRSGVTGGLIVHLGCGDGKLSAALRQNDATLVHGLDTSPENVVKAREHIRSLGLYGPVSVARFDGQLLPYADNLVNLLIISGTGVQVAEKEIERVLCPDGVAMRLDPETGKLRSKPLRKAWPGELDEWTHYLYDASCNPVGKDREFGPPKHLRWTAGPLWARSHGWTPSVSAMVSAKGRLFYICDETTTGMDATVPSKWSVVARDAFNGVLLWKHSISRWGSAAFSGTPDDGRGVPAVGRFTMPPHAARRLVAVDDAVYVTLGPAAPIAALDARTGKVKRVYPDTAGTDEILFSDGKFIVALNPPETARPGPVPEGKTPPAAPGKRICVVDARTGTMVWNRGPFSGVRSTRNQDPFGRLELCVGDGKVFALTARTIECLDVLTGKSLWQTRRPVLPEKAVTRMGYSGYFEYLLAVMSYSNGIVLLAQPEPNIHHTYHTVPGTLHAFDATTGVQMWKHAYGGWGHQTPPEVFVVGELVWSHVNAKAEFAPAWGKGYRAKDPSKVDYRVQALDLRSGKLVKEYSTKDMFNVGHHHRCYRNRITENYLLSSRRGVEFMDLATGENYQNHWVRSGCLIGNLPCNGLLYVTPHPCRCYLNTKLIGFNALAPRIQTMAGERRSARGRLYRTQAYDAGAACTEFQATDRDWPTYRHDPGRSGSTTCQVDTNLAPTWKTALGARPSAPVIARGKVFVATVDTHTVHAIDAATGASLWEYTADARVDSPPTYHEGLVIFGSRAGRVSCLRASDGALLWRFEAAPESRWISAFGQLESPWPVPGSVLVQEGKCWFAAGRSSYLDDGITVYALEPATGEVIHEEVIYSPDPETRKATVVTDGFSMAGLLNDIPGSDGRNVFIRQQQVSAPGPRAKPRLFSTAGYLDPSWFNRTSWRFGNVASTGLMVLGTKVAFGMEVYTRRGADSLFSPGSGAYSLRCFPLGKPRAKEMQGRNPKKSTRLIWEQRVAMRVSAMVHAVDRVFVAGAPDIVDPDDPHGSWEGRKGGMLAVYEAQDGKKLEEYTLPAPPVWDGMAAAAGRLFISMTDGSVICLGPGHDRE